MTEIQDGIHDDVTIEDYHENKTHVSATQLKYAKQSLRHFNWYITGKLSQIDKPHFSFGNSFELALLAQDEYLKKVAVMPESEWFDEVLSTNADIKTVRATTHYKRLHTDWLKTVKGKYIINETGPESFETIEEMLSSCFQDKYIQGLVKNTEYQLSLFWTDPETGIQLKTRPDFCKRKKNVIVNLKTTLDGSPSGFSKDIGKYQYALQAAIEIRGALATGLMPKVDSYFWLVVEKVAPFNATIYEFDLIERDLADDQLEFLLRKIARCREQNMYPGYGESALNEYGILMARIPNWSKSQPPTI